MEEEFYIELNKEIRSNIEEWRSSLKRAIAHKESGVENGSKWIECSEAMKMQLSGITNKVFKYNLFVRA